jgi:flagellar hook-associated protein 3 FlgL
VLTTAPYSKAANGVVSYAGNSIAMSLQVTCDTTLQIQLPGTDVFSGSVDVFGTLADLSTAIQAGDNTGIQTQLQNMQQIFSQLSTARTRVGGYMNLADGVSSHITSAGLLRAKNVNDVQNADSAQAITKLTLSQTNLQATLAVGARLTQLSLLDYL